MFPRELNKIEQTVLFKLLPENKSGYNLYRNKIDKMVIIGSGRFGRSNFVLGSEDDKPDLDNPSSPVVAIGVAYVNNENHHITIHEETDNKIEIELDGIDKLDDYKLDDIEVWSYSEWVPGELAPNDNSTVREVSIPGNNFLLVFAPAHKRIWLHEYESGINYLIPVTNYFNELMMIKREKSVKSPGILFKEINEFSNDELRAAFVNYSRYLNKFKIDNSDLVGNQKPKKKLFNIFYKRG